MAHARHTRAGRFRVRPPGSSVVVVDVVWAWRGHRHPAPIRPDPDPPFPTIIQSLEDLVCPQHGTLKLRSTSPSSLPRTSAATAGGEFNDWPASNIGPERDGDGSWQATVALGPGHRYRYLPDGKRWENASNADACIPHPYASDDSVIPVG